jgi:RNA polymerase sigma factor (sigma-70 family)
MVTDAFDCSTCTFVEPRRCELRVDPTFMEYRRRRLTYQRRAPRPGLEQDAHQVLIATGRAMDYREIARAIGDRRGTEPASGVLVQQALRAAPELFLDCGLSRFHAISGVLDFERPTDNLWFRPPPFDEGAVQRIASEARRLRIGDFALEMLPDHATVADVLRAIPGTTWRVVPELREIGLARAAIGADRVLQGGLDLIEQMNRRAPRPLLDAGVDRWGLWEAGRSARGRMITANLRLVGNVARFAVGRGLDYVDLCEEGILGLIKAVERFDPDRGFQFSTYATWWIRQTMTRAAAEDSRLIRVPVHKYEKSPWLMREHLPHQVPVGEPPSLWPIVSLDTLPESAHPVGDAIEAAHDALVRTKIDKALSVLTVRERQIVEKRFGLQNGRSMTLEDVGRDYGVTRERIRQIQKVALKRLRHPSRQLRLLLDDEDPVRRRKRARLPGAPVSLLDPAEREVLAMVYPVIGKYRPSIMEVARALEVDIGVVVKRHRKTLAAMNPSFRAALSAWRYGPVDRPMPARVAQVVTRAVSAPVHRRAAR